MALTRMFVLLSLVRISQGNAQSDFKNLMEEFWEWRLQQFPEFATAIGVNTYNDQIQSFNFTVFAFRKNAVEGLSDRIKAISKTDLSEGDKVNYDIASRAFQLFINGYDWLMYGGLNPVNFMRGDQTNPRYVMNYPLSTKQDFENLISRLSLTERKLAEYTYLFGEAIRLERTYNNVSVAKVPGQIEKMLVDDPVQFIQFEPFNETLDNVTSISNADKQDLRSRAVIVINDNVLAPYRAFKSFLENEYMPHTRTAAGVGSWSNGQDYYRECLKWHLSLDMTPDQVHQKGREEVDRISQEMIKVIRRQGFEGTIPEYYDMLQADSAFKLPSSDAIIEEYRRLIFDRINPKLSTIFRDIPDLPLRVEAMPYDGSSGGYSTGSEDGSRPGTFYANVWRPEDTNTFDMMALALHEANPGHHLQISYQLSQTLPPYRKHRNSQYSIPFSFPTYTSFTEGWGLYSEALGVEMGLYKDDYELMGRYSREMLRACRLVVDTGMHAFGWTRESAILYMLNYTSFARSEIENQIDRYMTLPGQACAYKIGELKIWEIRRKAEKDLGEDFDIKEFHATVLDLGAVPLDILEQAVDDMIETVKARSSHSTVTQSSVVRVYIIAILLSLTSIGFYQ